MKSFKSPNNWPREGEHNTVTAEYLDRLKLHQAEMHHLLQYTLDRDVEVQVNAAEHAAKTYEYNRGHRILANASQNVRRECRRVMAPARVDMQLVKQEAQDHMQGRTHSQPQDNLP